MAAEFLFATCQIGAETALKAEFARRWPQLRAAFSRPGFVTFKAGGLAAPELEDLDGAVFARACGRTLTKFAGSEEELIARAAELALAEDVQGLHVWRRDAAGPGRLGNEPGLTDDDRRIAKRIRRAVSPRELATWVQGGQRVLDCLAVDPNEWCLGVHRAVSISRCWPGGFCGAKLPENAVNRTYLKMEEALRWADFPLREGQRWVEIGSAPGGAAQALLNRGQRVTGIDPADMDPRLLAHPNFIHLRKRGADVRRREFRRFRHLTADMNVAPRYTLDTVEAIVTHPGVNIRALLLTLKLLDWKLADALPEYLFRIRTWGYPNVRARQLEHNRQEVCVAAARGG